MFEDETGFGRINKPKYCCCDKGIRPSVPCHYIREYRYVYGAVEPLTGDSCFLVMPYCNTDCVNVFLLELSEQFKDDVVLLCCDGAAWHKSKTLEIPSKTLEIPKIETQTNVRYYFAYHCSFLPIKKQMFRINYRPDETNQ